jgi:hypothetical protein
MTIGFYYHDQARRPKRYGPFWLSLKRSKWKFPLGEWVGIPKDLIKKFGRYSARVAAIGREGSNVIVHLQSC